MNQISVKLGQIRTLYNENLWQGRVILATLILILVMVVVRISLPYTIIYSVTYWLNSQGISTYIEDVNINIHKGTFTIIDAKGTRDGNSVFQIGKASIDWEWRPLSRKTIHIKSVELDGVRLTAAQYSDAVQIAGIVIKDDGSVEQPPAEEDSVAWGASLNEINFSKLGFCLQQFDTSHNTGSKGNKLLDYCGDVDKVTWQGDFSLATAGPEQQDAGTMVSVDGTLEIEHLSLFNNILDKTLLSTGSISLSDIEIDGINDIKLDSLSVAQLALLQDSGHTLHQHAVEFDEFEISGISIRDQNTVEIKAISLSKPVFSMSTDETGKFGYEQWMLPQQEADAAVNTAETENRPNTGTGYTINLGNIKITDTEACYQQPARNTEPKSRALDYCLTLASSEWTGNLAIGEARDKQPVTLSLNGNLSLAKLITTNKLLDRDLLNFDKFDVSDISVKGLDDLAFDRLSISNLTGLELTGAEDKHTIAIASIDASVFSYRNNALEINSVAVNDLGLEVTQNADGSLDFEKWMPESDEPEVKDKAEKTEAEPAETGEPVVIKIGEFSLDTTRLVEFTDLSVTPEMVIGLNELHFNIKDLDSQKPKQKSPLTLNAKTTRHGTIEIKGVAMPFDTKPSFDATGKITGLDLRAVSPKAEQAIGHTIKSGQMNADLKLVSREGQLDSNISLVLNHFKLKAKSKEDAAALDEKFGMPINQSLMLLKDKKDRIKLDIPITGDINNPAFDPTDAIIKATAKATTVTLITFYTPYGLAYAGGNVLFNLATALNFDPLIFEPGSAQLNAANEEQLSKLAKLLTERPAVHITLCGSTNLADRNKMFSEILDPKKTPPAPSSERLQALKKLAAERQQAVKDQLITMGKVAHDRLILCEPEHSDDADAIAGVEISI